MWCPDDRDEVVDEVVESVPEQGNENRSTRKVTVAMDEERLDDHPEVRDEQEGVHRVRRELSSQEWNDLWRWRDRREKRIYEHCQDVRRPEAELDAAEERQHVQVLVRSVQFVQRQRAGDEQRGCRTVRDDWLRYDRFELELRDVVPEAECRSREIDRDDHPRVPQRNGLDPPRERREIQREALSRVRCHLERVSVRVPGRRLP